MDDLINLTIALGGYLYIGQLLQWRAYCHALIAGRIRSYKASSAYGNQSLKNFFELLRSTWKRPAPIPTPEAFGLIPLRPETTTQAQLIDELLA